MSHVDQFNEFARKLSTDIITWARPEGWGPSITEEWPLTKLEHALPIAIGYLLFVFLGQIIMPFLPTVRGLYPFKFAYNMVQVMLCSYMCIEAGVRAWSAGYTLIPCNAFDHANPPIAFILYVFYLSKILDFLDTVFIILEKRWKQLSFLHVYHHTSIFLFYWLNINVGYDGDVYLTIVLNGVIHTVMYTYYFVSLHTKEIWWKSALTMSQMVQFVLMNAQAGYLLYYGCSSYPNRIIIAYLYYIMTLLALFAHFFVLSYVWKKPSDKKKGAKAAVKDE
eukprot:CAMPEP_0184978416 /NCGR_PEP_ID=MMETSP1098-20130426/8897_1 /TAXON_ID=89044 /ORGANISM="Spumella elongata, Strain CCAP 955/1" /LENGTH=278 /DNA_ID=CAMNT_0027501539 /DNA_START=90 /DNA_END=926 /DNA_ORIENTATION=+